LKEKNKNNKRFKLLLALVHLQSYLVRNYKPFKKRAIVFLVFVVLSSFLWLYRALDDNFVASISYPVHYQNLPKNKILISTPPQKIALRVRGNGYTLLSNKLKVKAPLNFNINSFLFYKQANDSMSVYILTRYARETLSEELNKKNSGLEIINIAPDSIFFSFTKTRVKKVPIKPNVLNTNNMFARQHMLNGAITIKPNTINISGPATLIDTIKFLRTTQLSPTELSDTLNKKVKILKIANVEIPEEKAIITIPVDKFTETGFELPILTKHVPDSINMKLFPRNVQVSFNITHSNYSKISKTDFILYVDYDEITNSKDKSAKRVTIKIDSIPSYAHAFRIYPSSVEFINELNHAEDRNNGRNR
jgi:hypothetical protein